MYVPVAVYKCRKCSVCGLMAKANYVPQSKFLCQQCGYAENVDRNAARTCISLKANPIPRIHSKQFGIGVNNRL